MGDHTYPKTKLGYSITRNRHIPTKILSVLMALLMVTTVFSSVTSASEEKDVRAYVEEVIETLSDGQGDKFSGKLLDFISQRLENPRRLLSLRLVTKYQSNESSDPIEKSTRMRLVLPTSIDVNGDHVKDIRVWVIRRPAVDLRPPAVCWKTTLIIRRLPGMTNIKDDFLEVGLEYKPRLFSLLDASVDRIRIGYQSPMDKEIPKTCIVTHKNIPHFLYPRKKTSHRVGINPISILGREQLNLLFSVVDKDGNGLSVQVNHSPAVINEISFDLSKDRFIRRGQTLKISRRLFGSSNVTVIVKDSDGSDSGYLMVSNVPRKISLSWFLGRSGYVELNSYNSGVGAVKAVVKDVITLGFIPRAGINASLRWDGLTLRGLGKGEGFNLAFDVYASAVLSDVYVNVPNFELNNNLYKLNMIASLLSLDVGVDADVDNLVLKPSLGVDKVEVEVENADVVLENCTIDLESIEPPVKPTVSITSPKHGDTVQDIVPIEGTASAPPGETIDYVEISVAGETISAEYNNKTGEWSCEWNTTTVLNGDYSIVAKSFYNGIESDKASVTVTVANEGVNWYPLVQIKSPEYNEVVSGVVNITGTASDPYGTISKVEVLIIPDGGWKEATVDEDGNWFYEWDTSTKSGKQTIYARSFDETDYSDVDWVEVFVRYRYSDVLEFTLSEASINVTNFVVQGDLPVEGITSIEVPAFLASGNGSLMVADGAVSLEVSGSLEIYNTSIYATTGSSEETLLENLTVEFSGYARVLLSDVIEVELKDVSLNIHADAILSIGNISLSLSGTGSVELCFSHNTTKFDLSLDASSGIDIRDLDFEHSGFVIKAGRIVGSGTADFLFIIDEPMGSCRCNISMVGLEIHNLFLSYNGLSKFIYLLDEDGVFGFVLYADFSVETGDDWIKIIMGGNGAAQVWIDTNFTFNGTKGGLKATATLKTGDKPLVIYLYNLSGNIGVSIDGSALLELEYFHLWYGDQLDVSIPGLLSVAFTLDTVGKTGSLLLNITQVTASIDVDLSLDHEGETFTLGGKLDIDVSAKASGNVSIKWDESGVAVDGKFGADIYGYINLTSFVFKNEFINISIEKFSIFGIDLDVEFSIEDEKFSIIGGATFTNIKLTNASIYGSISDFDIPFSINTTDIDFIGNGTIEFEVDGSNVIAIAKFVGDSKILVNVLWIDIIGLHVIGVEKLDIHGPTTITVHVDSSEDIPVSVTINTTEHITVEYLYLGPDFLMAWDVSCGAEAGSLTIGLSSKENIVLGVDGMWYLAGLSFNLEDAPQSSITDISINGSLLIEFELDLDELSYIYLSGNANEYTTISSGSLNIAFDPGRFSLRMQQSGFVDVLGGKVRLFAKGNRHIMLAGYTTSWITIKGSDDSDLIKLKGYINFYWDISVDENGTINTIFNIKELGAAIIIADALRIIGEIEATRINISCYLNNSNGTITIKDVDVDVTGDIAACIWVKPDGGDWIPILPFSISGAVILLVGGGLAKEEEPKKFGTTGDTKYVSFEAWFAPPIGFDGGDDGPPYTFNFSFGDGTYDEITTNKTEVSTGHTYELGVYDTKVFVTIEDSVVAEDKVTIEVFREKMKYVDVKAPKGVGVIPEDVKYGIIFLNYEDGDDERYVHTYLKVRNKADKDHPYTLHWEASADYRDVDWDVANWTFEPPNGTLKETEETIVNLTLRLPSDYKDHVEEWRDGGFAVVENTQWRADSDCVYFLVYYGRVEIYPTDTIYFPRLNPGQTKNCSLWIRNVGRKPLNWSISGPSNNATWTFSPSSGKIPTGGGCPVRFTIIAPDEYGVDLSGKINVTNIDDPTDYDTLNITAGTKSNGSGGSTDGGFVITSDGENISIKIGGYNEIDFNDFSFIIQDIPGRINGNFTFDFNDSYVYINLTKIGSKITNFSVEGTGEFTIENFVFIFGDDISVNISRVITGGFNLTNSGKLGSFSLAVNESYVDVGINIHLNCTNLALMGDVDVNISSNCSGTLWIDWNLTGEKPNVSFGGDLSREGFMEVSIRDLVFKRDGFLDIFDNFTLTADELSFVTSEGSISVSDEFLNIATGFESILFDDLYIEVNMSTVPKLGGSLNVSGVFDLPGSAAATLSWKKKEYLSLDVTGSGSIELSDIYVNRTGGIIGNWTISCSSLNLSLEDEATASLEYNKQGGILIVNASAAGSFDLTDFNLSIGENFMIKVDLLHIGITGDANIKLANTNLTINASGDAYISIIDFYLEYNGTFKLPGNVEVTPNISLSIPLLNVDLTGGAQELTIDLKPKPKEAPPLRVSPLEVSIYIGIGDRLQLKAITDLGVNVSWSSNDTSVATVDENGVVTGVAAGTAKINATTLTEVNRTKTATITVIGYPPSDFYTTPVLAKLEEINDTLQLTPHNHVPPVTWTSSDPTLISVDSTGLVTVHAPGTVTIAAEDDTGATNTSIITKGEITSTETAIQLAGDISVSGSGSVHVMIANGFFDPDPLNLGVDNISLEVDMTALDFTCDDLSIIGNKTTTKEFGGQVTTTTVSRTLSCSSLSMSGPAYAYLYADTNSGTFKVDVTIGDLFIDDFYLSINEITTTDLGGGLMGTQNKQLLAASFSSLDIYRGYLLFSISNTYAKLSGSVEQLEWTNLYFYVDLEKLGVPGIQVTVEWDSIEANDIYFLLFLDKWRAIPPSGSGDVYNYTKLVVDCFSKDAYVDVDDFSISGLGPLLDLVLGPWNLEVEGTGDVDIRIYQYKMGVSKPAITTRLGSIDGFSGEWSITGPLFGILTREKKLTISPGHLTLQFNAESDGFIYIDTGGESFEIDSVIVWYIFGIGFRIRHKNFVLEADNFGIHWNNLIPPKGVYFTGRILPHLGKVYIDVGEDFDGDGNYTWYDMLLPPVPKFTYTVEGLTVYFNATESFDLDGYITQYDWQWNYIGPGEWWWLIGGGYNKGPEPKHTYDIPGWHKVGLRVHDNNGKKTILTKWIYTP